MLALFLLLQIIVLCNSEEKFDPKKVNYCDLPCDGHINSACKCSKTPYREEVLDNITKFRQAALNEHNYYRELVASGNETRSGLTSAADMQALSYSLEIEYMIRCLARNSFTGGHDVCRKMSNNVLAGQNLGWHYEKRDWKGHLKHIKTWYEEITSLPDSPSTVEKFRGSKPGYENMIGHFVQVIWSSVSLIGCTRFHGTNNKKINYKEDIVDYPYALICDYAPLEPTWEQTIKRADGPIYKRGKPCTECFSGKCENPEYPSLCGKIQPVPTDPPYDFGGATRIFSTVTTCRLFSAFLLSLIYLYCN